MLVPQANLRPLLRTTSREWRANLRRLFQRSHFILGEELRAFELEFAAAMGGKFSIGVANGTSAIELCLRDAGVTSGEVITSGQTLSRRSRSRSEEHTSELQSPDHLVCRLLLEKKKCTLPATSMC